MSDIQEKVEEIIKRLEIGADGNINPNARLIEDLGIDSINIMYLQVEIEDCFGFQFDVLKDDFEEIFNTIGGLCSHIERRKGLHE